ELDGREDLVVGATPNPFFVVQGWAPHGGSPLSFGAVTTPAIPAGEDAAPVPESLAQERRIRADLRERAMIQPRLQHEVEAAGGAAGGADRQREDDEYGWSHRPAMVADWYQPRHGLDSLPCLSRPEPALAPG